MKLPFADSFVIPRGDVASEPVFDGIVEGFWPFRPESVRIFMDYDIDFNRYRLLSEVLFGDQMFPHMEWVPRDEILDMPYVVLAELGQKFKHYYRNRPTLPNDGYSGHHHHLGAE